MVGVWRMRRQRGEGGRRGSRQRGEGGRGSVCVCTTKTLNHLFLIRAHVGSPCHWVPVVSPWDRRRNNPGHPLN